MDREIDDLRDHMSDEVVRSTQFTVPGMVTQTVGKTVPSALDRVKHAGRAFLGVRDY